MHLDHIQIEKTYTCVAQRINLKMVYTYHFGHLFSTRLAHTSLKNQIYFFLTSQLLKTFNMMKIWTSDYLIVDKINSIILKASSQAPQKCFQWLHQVHGGRRKNYAMKTPQILWILNSASYWRDYCKSRASETFCVASKTIWRFFRGSWTSLSFTLNLRAFIKIQMTVCPIQNDYLDHLRYVWNTFGTIQSMKFTSIPYREPPFYDFLKKWTGVICRHYQKS